MKNDGGELSGGPRLENPFNMWMLLMMLVIFYMWLRTLRHLQARDSCPEGHHTSQ